MNKAAVLGRVSALGLSICLTAVVHAENWPSFRGPNASGIADERPLPTSWDTKNSTNILWRTPLPGLGHSSPVVWGDRVFVTLAISGAPKLAYNPKDDDVQPA